MKVSNFNWTDKDSARWFILLSNGHVGPYTLSHLIRLHENKKLFYDSQLWAEGLTEPILFKFLLNHENLVQTETNEDELPPPVPEEVKIFSKKVKTKSLKLVLQQKTLFFLLVTIIFILSLSFLLLRETKKIDIPRLAKMSVEMHHRILNENVFEGWEKSISFKEYFGQDHSQIWLVTSGYQNCDVEATFISIKDKLLSYKDENISFSSKGHLSGHLVEFTTFDFNQGVRIIPGLYEMNIKAINCQWDGIMPRLMNGFKPPEKKYLKKMKVLLYSSGLEEFKKNLSNVQKKKILVQKNIKKRSDLVWQDLSQKFHTLEAITNQIEQLFLDFLEPNPKQIKKNLKFLIDQYSKKFGTFLTSFITENEKSFKMLSLKGVSEKRDYELMVKLTTKSIGLESMRLIEEFQDVGDLSFEKNHLILSEKVKIKFLNIKKDINRTLILISQDQESLPHIRE
jgi:hypothetical protein